VDWWPWGEEAFAEARRRDVPLFVSVGYSTCHWCHVMAHESFEDASVAGLMNDAFVCVKVDREERPDVDESLMAVCQAMSGSGGWPLSVVMAPDKRPFFAGTYFPRESKWGRIGMLDLVPRIQQAWQGQRAKLLEQADHTLAHLSTPPRAGGGELGVVTIDAGAQGFLARFDAARGGFGPAPKFPSPHNLLFLLRHHHRTGNASSLQMVETTLEALQSGGIRDHLGGGFHRYSTDEGWLVPHFEKMLYDQALLAFAFAEAHQATGRADFAATCRATLDYALRDLADPAGGFRSAEDADSEGVEGKFYVWREGEIARILGPADGQRFATAYGVRPNGNFRDEAGGSPSGANILHTPRPMTPAEAAALAPMRTRLLAERAKRVRPHLDDKVLTDWNGMAIAAFAAGGRILGEPTYTAAAVRAAGFLHASMRRSGGRLRHRWRAGARDEFAFLDDSAFLLWGLVELYEATLDARWLVWAVEVAGAMMADHADADGTLRLSPRDAERLPAARTDAYDGAMPSGNSMAAWTLARLGLLTGDEAWTRDAQRIVQAFSGQVSQHPPAFPVLLMAADLLAGPTEEVVIAGEGAEADAMLAVLRGTFRPRTIWLRAAGLGHVAAWTDGMRAPPGTAKAYACRGFACDAPVSTAAELARVLMPGAGAAGSIP
jgi:uncharacterized protein YyaL (SSP411 family)